MNPRRLSRFCIVSLVFPRGARVWVPIPLSWIEELLRGIALLLSVAALGGTLLRPPRSAARWLAWRWQPGARQSAWLEPLLEIAGGRRGALASPLAAPQLAWAVVKLFRELRREGRRTLVQVRSDGMSFGVRLV